jgi:hypothetical protein
MVSSRRIKLYKELQKSALVFRARFYLLKEFGTALYGFFWESIEIWIKSICKRLQFKMICAKIELIYQFFQ